MKQQGFTLLEVLIAALVITLGLVAVVTMQVGSQKRGFETHQKNLAGLYAQDLQARLNADACYLSKANTDPDKNLENFIENNPDDKGLTAFIEKHKSEWQSKHFTGSRASWTSELTTDVAHQENDEGENVYPVENNGYWEFELTIKPTNSKKDEVKQRLIVRYNKGVCKGGN